MTYNPSDVARLLQVSVSTIQRWSKQFGAHLSADASPEPGQRRAYSEADVAILRRAQRMLQAGVTWQTVNAQLGVLGPEEAEEETTRDEAPSSAPDEAHERAQNSTASQALMVLSQQQRLIDGQAGQLTDQGARLRDQAAQIAGQAGEISALRERLARLEGQLEQLQRLQDQLDSIGGFAHSHPGIVPTRRR